MNKKMEQKMTKIEELIKSITVPVFHATSEHEMLYPIQVEMIMKEYAEFYAQKCLEIAVEKVQVNHLSDESLNCKLIVKAIDRMKLPEHE